MAQRLSLKLLLPLVRYTHRRCIYSCTRPERRLNDAHCRTFSSDSTDTPYAIRRYEELAKEAAENPQEFWAEQAERLDWFKKWDTVLDDSNSPFTRWFAGGELNTCHNALDRHVTAGKGHNVALIYDSPVTGVAKTITYSELLDQVSIFAGVLSRHGVGLGDRVLIYMPMIPEAIVAMLACARIGAIHSVVFAGFVAKELSVRISDCEPKVIVTASAGVESHRVLNYKPILDEAIGLSGWKPNACIVYERPHIGKVSYQSDRDYEWNREMEKSKPVPCASVPATDPLYILYTSGTTGRPKGIVRPSGGHAVVLPWTLQAVYGMLPGEVWWAASELGWVVGHSYVCYGPLMLGLQSVVFEGNSVDTPDTGSYFRVISEYNVKSIVATPTALRSIRRKDAKVKAGTKHIENNWNLKTLFPAGEHLDYDTRCWTEDKFRVPVLDHYYQTESGYPITATCAGVSDPDLNPPKDASGVPVPGWNVKVIKEAESFTKAAHNELGHIVIKLPLPPGAASTFWRNDEGFEKTYFTRFPGYYDTMDAGSMTKDGYVCVMSRVDDVIKVAGHRISSGALEEAIMYCSAVIETAVIGLEDAIKGTVPLSICVLHSGYDQSVDTIDKVQNQVVEIVRHKIGPVASLKRVVIVSQLPKTRSGKITRSALAAMVNNKPFKIPVTVEDASVFTTIRDAFIDQGINVYGSDPEGIAVPST